MEFYLSQNLMLKLLWSLSINQLMYLFLILDLNIKIDILEKV